MTYIPVLIRYCIATFGLFIGSFGVAFSVISNLGTSPISSPAYVWSLGGYGTLGMWLAVMHVIMILLQWALLRRRFKLRSIFEQLATTALWACFADLAMLVVGDLAPTALWLRWVYLLLGCAILAFGIGLMVAARTWLLSGEMTIRAIATHSKWSFGTLKICFDGSLVVIALVSSLIFYRGHINGVNVGTFVAAFLVGFLIKLILPTLRTWIPAL